MAPSTTTTLSMPPPTSLPPGKSLPRRSLPPAPRAAADRTLAVHDALAVPLIPRLPALRRSTRGLHAQVTALITNPTPSACSTLVHLSLSSPYSALLPRLLTRALRTHPSAALTVAAHLVAHSPYYYRPLAIPAFAAAIKALAKARAASPLPSSQEDHRHHDNNHHNHQPHRHTSPDAPHPVTLVASWAAAMALAYPVAAPGECGVESNAPSIRSADPAVLFWQTHALALTTAFPDHPSLTPAALRSVCPYASLADRAQRRARRRLQASAADAAAPLAALSAAEELDAANAPQELMDLELEIATLAKTEEAGARAGGGAGGGGGVATLTETGEGDGGDSEDARRRNRRRNQDMRAILMRYDAAMEAAARASSTNRKVEKESPAGKVGEGDVVAASAVGTATRSAVDASGQSSPSDAVEASNQRPRQESNVSQSSAASVAAIARERARERGMLGTRSTNHSLGVLDVAGGGGGGGAGKGARRGGGLLSGLLAARERKWDEEPEDAEGEETSREFGDSRSWREPSECAWSDAEEEESEELSGSGDKRASRRGRGAQSDG